MAKKYYLVEVTYRSLESFDTTEDFIFKFDSLAEATDRKFELVDACPDGCFVSWKCLTPVVTCACGRKVYCNDFTNTCGGCGSDYNHEGALLAPREFWGEETGESFAECY